LRSDGRDDAGAAVDHALAYAQSVFGDVAVPPRGVAPEDVVVVAARRGTPLWQVLREIETAL
ncbi:TetR family transcriptional regulator, partial [Streptomyces ardesiacus]